MLAPRGALYVIMSYQFTQPRIYEDINALRNFQLRCYSGWHDTPNVFSVYIYLSEMSNHLSIPTPTSNTANMKQEETLLLQWSDFQENLSTSVEKVQARSEFCDVTLACEDESDNDS